MKRFYKTISLFILLIAVIALNGLAQSFDYPEKPARKFDFLKTDIKLELNTEKTAINGSVTYLLEVNNSGADSLVLNAPEIAIDSVFSENQPLQYTLESGRLVIPLTDSTFTRPQFRIKIFYHADPRFGLLKDSDGTIWTSLLPKSHRHWLPSPDHPGIETITTLTLVVPASSSVAATGVKTEHEILGLDSKSVTYRSGRPVPITSLAFAVGKLKKNGSSFGIKRIITYAETCAADQPLQNELAQTAKRVINEIENAAKMDYPYQRLHVVILNDHFWEQKPYGANVIYLYKNRGDLINQLRRGIYGQWFGVYQHEAQWAAAWPMQLFQSALHYKIADSPIYLRNEASPELDFQTVYDAYSVKHWNFWQQLPRLKSETELIAEKIIPEVLLRGSGTFTEQRYRNLWYRLSGEPIINIPSIQKESRQQSDSIYSVRVDVQPINDSLKVLLTVENDPIEKPKSISIKVIRKNAADTNEMTLKSAKDSIFVPSAGVQNIILSSRANIEFKIHKPVPFILYQLDQAENEKARKKAARQLGFHTDNPDIQLIITDYLKKETEPEVKAALLRSYATITNGASGTQQYFIKALESSQPEVREAAIEGIQNYKSDKKITQKIKSFIEQADTLNAELLKIYMQRIDSTRALDFAKTLVQQDTSGIKVVQAISALAFSGEVKPSVKFADFYVQPVYAYSVRKKALFVLLKYDDSAQKWKERIDMLLSDLDPRIRYLTLQNLSNIPGVQRGEALQTYIPEAYDARIHYSMSNEQ
ncbi:MAG TPA: HEAT repeat domain-containing protein [Balneolaceae bacterium]|nr:HEAT repeat domain-containing protein [Balneolaceae bacterium]